MALQVTNLKREFRYTDKDKKVIYLSDPNPKFTTEEALKFYIGTYPELTNALIEGPKIEGDKAVFSISTKAGQLG